MTLNFSLSKLLLLHSLKIQILPTRCQIKHDTNCTLYYHLKMPSNSITFKSQYTKVKELLNLHKEKKEINRMCIKTCNLKNFTHSILPLDYFLLRFIFLKHSHWSTQSIDLNANFAIFFGKLFKSCAIKFSHLCIRIVQLLIHNIVVACKWVNVCLVLRIMPDP